MGAWASSSATPSEPDLELWSALPPELADLVLRRLPSHADRVRFASVCRRWRHVATRYSSLPPALPWLWPVYSVGPFQSLPDGERHSDFGFTRSSARCYGSFGEWLLFDDAGLPQNRRLYLWNPLSRATMQLPGRFKQPGRHTINPDGHGLHGECQRPATLHVSKVIVCSSELIIAKVFCRPDPQRPDMVACCRPAMSAWSSGLCNGQKIQDIAWYEGRLYALSSRGDLFVYRVSEDSGSGEPAVSAVQRVINPASPSSLYASFTPWKPSLYVFFLVSCKNKLLMVSWTVPFDHYTLEDSTKDMSFKVFEADFQIAEWLELESMEDQALFVSRDCSKAIKASDYLPGNKIYFVDDFIVPGMLGPPNNPRTCGVYDLNNKTIQSIAAGELLISDWFKGSWFFP